MERPRPPSGALSALEPWLLALQAVGLNHIADMPHVANGPRESWWGFRTVDSEPRRRAVSTWTLVREALELLELLARVEPLVAQNLLLVAAGVADPLLEAQLPRFRLRVDEDLDALDAVTQEGILHLLTHDGRAPTETYDSVKASLLAQWAARHGGRALDRDVDGRVQLAIEFTTIVEEDRVPGMMATLRSLTSAHARNVSPSSVETSVQKEQNPFALHSLHLRLVRESDAPVTNDMLQQLNEMATTGVPITYFYFVGLLRAQLNVVDLGKFMLNQFLPPRGLRGKYGVRDLEICACTFDTAAIQAFCTAIARSTSLHNLDFEIADGFGDDWDSAEWWRWLTYAVFSHHTDHAIHTVTLNLSTLTMDHVRSIREMLLHNNPLALLYQATLPTTDDWPLSMATLDESATIYPGRHDTSAPALERPSIQLNRSALSCQVVRDRADEEFVEVILPGSSVCWLSRSDVVEVKPIVQRNAHPVRELHIIGGQFGGQAAQPITEFLQLVGGALERLDLSHGEDMTDDIFCSSILASCPNLKHLKLESMLVESFDWLAEAPTTCKLMSLEVRLGESASRGPASWTRVLEALSDTSHPLAKSLRHLRIDLRRPPPENAADADAAVEDAICRYFVAMLDKNRLLQRCELLSCSWRARRAYASSFAKHHNEPLSEPESPLPLVQRLAFVSATSSIQVASSPRKQKKTTSDSTPVTTPAAARTKLTPEIVSMVFAFAAKPKRRVCVMTSD